MNRWRNPFYIRLVLVLLVAMSASFASMYCLFQTHLASRDEQGMATAMAAKVTILQELIENHLDSKLPLARGMRVVDAPPAPIAADGSLTALADRLGPLMGRELAHHVDIRATSAPVVGFWIDLVPDDTPPPPGVAQKWLFMPIPKIPLAAID